MDATTYAMDIAKNVFQVHWVETGTGEIHRKKLSRGKVIEFFARHDRGCVAMEACGGAHHWARELSKLGHAVELLPAHQIRAFVVANKDDAADARAIWLAAQHQDIRRVPIKTVQQQAELSVHRMRTHWVQVRTATVNTLRGLLHEFGIVLPKGRIAGLRSFAEQRADHDTQLPALMAHLVDAQLEALRQVDERIDAFDREIELMARSNDTANRLRKVPGIGPVGATALAATIGDGSGWRNAREFACCVGLAPRHTGTGGKVRIGKISKRGNAYLRTLLIHGARNLTRVANPPEWIAQMLQRRPFNVVATAVAHKLARTAWAMAAHGSAFEPRWTAMQPAS